MMTAAVVRTILMIDMVAMALLALVYLRQRRMSWVNFFCWGLVATCVPVLGPFLLIANHPGQWDPDFSFSGEFQRMLNMAARMLPDAPAQGKKRKKQTLAERVRSRKQARERKTSR